MNASWFLAQGSGVFPLQAALGYSIAQTLFLGKKCVIVEGITDYWIMKTLDGVIAIDALAFSKLEQPFGSFYLLFSTIAAIIGLFVTHARMRRVA